MAAHNYMNYIKSLLLKLYTISLVVLMVSCNTIVKDKGGTSTFQVKSNHVFVYTTSKNTPLRLTPTDTLIWEPYAQPLETEVSVFLDRSKTFQTFMGIGGAITDASAETFEKLSNSQQEKLLKAYFNSSEGIGYTLARTHINSCDFSSESYTYITDGDSALATFDISPDQKHRIPLIKRAIEAADGSLAIYVSPWSPPAWMKTNGDMLHGGKLLPQFRSSWANYYTKFIKAYEKAEVPIWGLTVQNEPMAKQIWESCIYTAEEERDFIKDYLGPTLEKNGLADKKIIAWDHNRDLIFQRASVLMNDPDASKYIWGIGFHWYEDWSGGNQTFDNVQKVNESWSGTNLLFTEGCNSPFDGDSLMNWELGERYGNSMIHDFNAGSVGWTDWNILLDEKGGPNHVGNYCFAPIHGNTKTGELIFTNAYYYIGHFSKFIKPGAKRIQASPSRSNLLATSFQNPDGSIVAVVMNETDKEVPYLLWLENNVAKVKAKPHSIATLLLN